MIITYIGGGLGNQMFQYALGKKLSIKNNDELLLDISNFSGDPTHKHYREYGLCHFNVTAPIATPEQIRKIKYPFGKLFAKLKNRFERDILKISDVKFEPSVLEKKGNLYMEGYWQTEKYFKDIRDVLLQEFSLKTPFSEEAQKISEKIAKSKNSVSVHIRRGDFAESEESRKYHGTDYCNPEYYSKSLKYIFEKVGDLSVFIFSDDIGWAEKNINLPYETTYVSEKSCADHEHLVLMSLCDYHVIANSTFGWWSAWLDNKPQKIVIAPSRWRPGPRLPTDDILPPEWIRIK